MNFDQKSIRAFPKLWLVIFSGIFLFLTIVVHQTGFSAGGGSVQYLPVVQRPSGGYWSYRYDAEDGYYEPFDIQKLADSTFLITGSYDNIADGRKSWVMKVDGNGTIIWNKSFDQPNLSEFIHHVLPTADGGAILVGYLRDTVNYGWIVKLNNDGSIGWQKRYSYGLTTSFHSATLVDNGDIVVTGLATLSNYNSQALVMRLKNNGNIVWSYTYGGETSDVAASVVQADDGGFIVAGHKPSIIGDYDIWVLKLNSDGSVAWQKSYELAGHEGANFVLQTGDGNYIVAGKSQSLYGQYEGLLLLKLTADGAVIWQKFYQIGSDSGLSSLQHTVDGYFIAAGFSILGTNTHWVMKLDANGNAIWSRGYQAEVQDDTSGVFTVVTEAAPGQYLIAAKRSVRVGPFDDRFMLLAKVNALGEVPGCHDIVPLLTPSVNVSVSPENSDHLPKDVTFTVQNEFVLVQNLSAQMSLVCSP